MRILFITAGLVAARGASNSYQEALIDGLVELGHQVSCLCTAQVRLMPVLSWTLIKDAPYKVYTVFNGGVYPALYSHGGVGTRKPMRDVKSSHALRRTIDSILKLEKPEVVSLQSLFGLPFNLIEEFRRQGIPVVFTAHDYFALCPTAHLFLPDNKRCRLSADELVCEQCCDRSPSYWAFWITYLFNYMADRLARWPRISKCIWRLRNMLKKVDQGLASCGIDRGGYSTRRREAIKILGKVDILHCISQRQVDVFTELCGPLDNIRILPLMPPTIGDLTPFSHVTKKNKALTLVALNINRPYKGSELLEKTFRLLAGTKSSYEMHIYGNNVPGPKIPGVIYHGRYQSCDLDKIAASADFCIVPSKWDETLGFVGMEMMARGVPLIVSSYAGVSEFVESGITGFIFNPDSVTDLANVIEAIIKQPNLRIAIRNNLIKRRTYLKTFGMHLVEMEELLSDTLKNGKKKNIF